MQTDALGHTKCPGLSEAVPTQVSLLQGQWDCRAESTARPRVASNTCYVECVEETDSFTMANRNV